MTTYPTSTIVSIFFFFTIVEPVILLVTNIEQVLQTNYYSAAFSLVYTVVFLIRSMLVKVKCLVLICKGNRQDKWL